MATILTTPAELGRQLEAISLEMREQSRALVQLDALAEEMLKDGYPPAIVKSAMDSKLRAYADRMMLWGTMLGINTVAPDSVTAGNPLVVDPNLLFKFATRWQVGSPPGLSWLRTGQSDLGVSIASGEPLNLVGYNHSEAVKDIFAGLMKNDVVQISGCSWVLNDGRYSLKYHVADFDDDGNIQNGDFGAATGWTEGASNGNGWSIAGGEAAYYSEDSSTVFDLTQALSGMTQGAGYFVEFSYSGSSADSGTLICTLAGADEQLSMTIPVLSGGTARLFVAAPSATPTLRFRILPTNPGTTTFTLHEVSIYGAPALAVNEAFDRDNTDATTVITLEQTAA